jgi:3-(3-hydroxy-phenyl)propionate hydroxylase
VQDAVNLGWKLAQVVQRTSPEDLLDSYHAERHPVGARMLEISMSAVALRRPDVRSKALHGMVSQLLGMDEPRKRIAAEMSGLGIRYDFAPAEPDKAHPLLGRRMPDLDLVTAAGSLRVFTLLHKARPALINFGAPGGIDIARWSDRVQLIDGKYDGVWELPALGGIDAPAALLIRPDGYVAWVGDATQSGLADALTRWFGPPAG